MVGKIYSNKLSIEDPLFVIKSIINQNNNYLHDKAREDKERLFTKFYFAISLFLGISAALFYEYISWYSIIILGVLLGIFLVIAIFRYMKGRKVFWSNREKMKESFEILNMIWKE